MAPINIQQSSIFFLILFFAIFSFSTSLAIAHDPSEVFSKYISPSSLGLKREKLSHLHFYLHDISAGKNATAVRVAEAPSSNTSSSSFGVVVMMDDPLTIKPDLNSTMVGRAQGITLSVLGRNKVLSSVREMPIVGGSGVFRFARGYAQAKTYSNGQVESIVEVLNFVGLAGGERRIVHSAKKRLFLSVLQLRFQTENFLKLLDH
ncbi:hypothetical protein COLO4_29379 [Corchorus olitorius]|uniref:Dirigent protein n=1 Tax=Corchorus olitorius TaxID=93759 RepID=A0A1R3HEN5_9ROSI|nr:hypothetical protein COLO4_29379 [Corchorus olitorius]